MASEDETATLSDEAAAYAEGMERAEEALAEAGADGAAGEEVEVEPEGGEEPVRHYDEETLRRREAALARIVQYGDPMLKSRSSEVTDFDQALTDEIERMFELMKDGLGVGLAAPQAGKLRRLLVFQTNADAEPQELVNPDIEWLSDETEVAAEGCLSIPRVIVEVDRPLYARVRGQDRNGAEVLIEASGHEARVLQHEIDHLDGILILDRTEKKQRKGAMKALRRGESYSPHDDD
ncbi:MAG TPA: peptide deformylase [Solirubrobacterales bacterium]|nr:peptide deformylase [Solirubrobacterales bacterium]HMX72033.1 peptide deformylase [Solirubrobacterales bacterium]HNA23505.1 peptide deformylase [Solirubrobacterales bacterium]HNA44126.1 peptide deformylase [Solirubrobacterales bacterium]HNC15331.1 peptide deformylase [Solirubrobacterales bacterium]